MKNLRASLIFLFLGIQVMHAQNAAIATTIDKVQFFQDTSVINATITTNLAQLLKKKDGAQYTANFSSTLPNGMIVDEPILLEIRGHFRKDYCYVPPIRIIFKSKKTSVMKPLGTLKLVSECKPSPLDEQYLFKEFLVYKIYNLLTDMSFRVRLLNLRLVDSAGKKKAITEHAFLLEDAKDLATRNNCVDWKDAKLNTEATDRKQMTMVALFQNMIGNTDWAVPNNHNIKLILSKNDTLSRPYAVPYDFDYSGFVNTDYAVPDEKLGIQTVTERLYRGFPRTMDELNEALNIFKSQKNNIYEVIKNFNLITSINKQQLYNYLDDFFKLINEPVMVNAVFIKEARKE